MRQIILASQSPRRTELLTRMGVQFEAIPSDFYEELDDSRSPEAVAQELGLGKALVLARHYPDAIVIGSDTIVTIDGRQLGKADSIEHARQMLQDEALHPNKITSSLAVVCLADNLQLVQSENAWVYFKPYDAQAVEAYLATGDYADKAGAWGIQSGAAPLIDHMSGNADTIVGLPTHLLAPILQQLGYPAVPVEYALPPEIAMVPTE
jgi:septum formation protein